MSEVTEAQKETILDEHNQALLRDFAIDQDKWTNRQRNMSCRFCMWYWPKRVLGKSLDESRLGRCRRRAPTLGGFPVVYSDDSCGDHKLDEVKVLMQDITRI